MVDTALLSMVSLSVMLALAAMNAVAALTALVINNADSVLVSLVLSVFRCLALQLEQQPMSPVLLAIS
jgi:hypothetical protein